MAEKFETNEIFRADDGQLYRYTGPAGGKPTWNTVERVSDAPREATPEPEGEPSFERPDVGHYEGIVSNLLNGISFGTGNEIAAGLESATGGRPYTQGRDERTDRRMAYNDAHPIMGKLAELGGAATTGGVTGAKFLKGAEKLPGLARAATTGLLGAAEGAVYGAGENEADRATGARQGGILGGLLGVPAAWLLNKGGSPVAKWGLTKAADTPESAAMRAVRDTAKSEGLDADEIIKRQGLLGREGVLADTSEGLRWRARAAVDQPGPAAGDAYRLMESRQGGMVDRLIDAAQGATGRHADDFAETVSQIEAARSAQSRPFYEKAKGIVLGDIATGKGVNIREDGIVPQGTKVQWTSWLVDKHQGSLDTIVRLMDRPAMKAAMRSAKTMAANEDVALDPSRLTVGDLHYAKVALDQMIESAKRGDSSAARMGLRALTDTKRQLLEAMDDISPDYKMGRDIFAGASELLRAGQYGRDFIRMEADEIDELVKGMGQSEKEMFRRGAVKSIVDTLEKTDMGRDATRRLIGSKAMRRKLANVFDSPESAERFLNAAKAEREMARTRLVTTGGSRTSQGLANASGLEQAIQPAGLLATMGTGQGLLSGGAQLASSLLGNRKLTPEVLDEISRMLLSRGVSPEEVRRIFSETLIDRTLGAGRSFGNITRGAVPAATTSLLLPDPRQQ